MTGETVANAKSEFGAAKPLAPIVQRLILPAVQFQQTAFAGGAVLLLATIVALAWSNSPWAGAYFSIWQTPVAIQVGDFEFSKPLLLWVNDALMAIFFFVIGLEIKREVLAGELSNPRNAILPLIAAAGGIVVPALVYTGVVLWAGGGEDAIRGWGVPAATDIAFSLGALSILGTRVPISAKVFLTTFAIADDIGATLIIAIFYSGVVNWIALGWAAAALAVMLAGNRLGFRATTFYALLSLTVWFAFLKSGVHPTIAGFLSAFAIPSYRRIEPRAFLESSRSTLDAFERSIVDPIAQYQEKASQAQESHFASVERSARLVQTPLQRLESALHPWVAFVILPVFALANAGVVLPSSPALIGTLISHPVTLGVFAGLVLGKPIGIFGATMIASKTGWFELPKNLSPRHIMGLSFLGGIGFTMSIFIASVGFGSGHGGGHGAGHFDAAIEAPGQDYSNHAGSPGEASAAKLGILLGSLTAGVAGIALLAHGGRRRTDTVELNREGAVA